MKTIKKLVSTALFAMVLLIVSTFSANAAIMTFSDGNVQFTGTIFLDTESGTSDTVGIGQIDKITNGTTTWLAGDNGQYINYYSENYTISTSTVPDSLGSFTFQTLANTGLVSFYVNTIGIFDQSQDFATQKTAISAGSLFLSTQESGITTGSVTPYLNGVHGNYLASGKLSVIGGSAAATFNTNTLLDNTGQYADLSFNISADTIHDANLNAQYEFSGSSDMNSKYVATVDAPGTLGLLGLGLIGLGIKRKYS